MAKWLILSLICMATLHAQAPIYLNIGSHSETTDPLHYQQTYADYEAAKAILLQIADTIELYDARWNMQLDANFIRGCIAHDTARTNPNNFIKWADDQTYIEVDPHNHFTPPTNPYNPTDLNHLLVDSCLIGTDRNNLGGFIWRDFTSPPCSMALTESWSHYNTTGAEAGAKFPGQLWRPVVLWGGGSPSHCEDANTLGIWKPTDATAANFYTHDPTKYETVIGSNCGDAYAIFDTTDVNDVIALVESVIDYAQVYGNSSTDFYTITVMFNFKNLQSVGMVDKISSFIRAMKPYETQGKVVWASLTEKYDTWNGSHTPTEYFIKQCTDMNLGTETVDISSMVKIFPNPTADYVQIRFPYEYLNATYELIDLSGKLSSNGVFTGNSISTEGLPNGLYFLKLVVDGNVAIKKLMVQH